MCELTCSSEQQSIYILQFQSCYMAIILTNTLLKRHTELQQQRRSFVGQYT